MLWNAVLLRYQVCPGPFPGRAWACPGFHLSRNKTSQFASAGVEIFGNAGPFSLSWLRVSSGLFLNCWSSWYHLSLGVRTWRCWKIWVEQEWSRKLERMRVRFCVGERDRWHQCGQQLPKLILPAPLFPQRHFGPHQPTNLVLFFLWFLILFSRPSVPDSFIQHSFPEHLTFSRSITKQHNPLAPYCIVQYQYKYNGVSPVLLRVQIHPATAVDTSSAYSFSCALSLVPQELHNLCLKAVFHHFGLFPRHDWP